MQKSRDKKKEGENPANDTGRKGKCMSFIPSQLVLGERESKRERLPGYKIKTKISDNVLPSCLFVRSTRRTAPGERFHRASVLYLYFSFGHFSYCHILCVWNFPFDCVRRETKEIGRETKKFVNTLYRNWLRLNGFVNHTTKLKVVAK